MSIPPKIMIQAKVFTFLRFEQQLDLPSSCNATTVKVELVGVFTMGSIF